MDQKEHKKDANPKLVQESARKKLNIAAVKGKLGQSPSSGQDNRETAVAPGGGETSRKDKIVKKRRGWGQIEKRNQQTAVKGEIQERKKHEEKKLANWKNA